MIPKILFNNDPDEKLLESLNNVGFDLLFGGKSMKGGNEGEGLSDAQKEEALKKARESGMQDYLVNKRPTSQEDQSGSVNTLTGEPVALNTEKVFKDYKNKAGAFDPSKAAEISNKAEEIKQQVEKAEESEAEDAEAEDAEENQDTQPEAGLEQEQSGPETIESTRYPEDCDDKCKKIVDEQRELNVPLIISKESVAGTGLKVFEGVAKGFVDGAAEGFSSALQAATGTLPERNWSEVAPELAKTVVSRADFVRNIFSDEPTRCALKELLETYAYALGEFHDISEPVMNEILATFWETVSEMGEKSAIGAVNTGLNIVKAGLGEIPVIGGLIDLALALAQAFNYFVAVAAPAIKNGSKIAAKVANDGGKAVKVFSSDNPKLQIGEKVRNFTTAASNVYKRTIDDMDKKVKKSASFKASIRKKDGGGKRKKKNAKKTTVPALFYNSMF